MMSEAEITDLVSLEIKRIATQRAKIRAKAAMWDLDVALFFFAILLTIIILLFQGVKLVIVAPAAIAGLAMGWLMGWRKGKQLYGSFYGEELSKLEKEFAEQEKKMVQAIEEKVQKALRDRQQ